MYFVYLQANNSHLRDQWLFSIQWKVRFINCFYLLYYIQRNSVKVVLSTLTHLYHLHLASKYHGIYCNTGVIFGNTYYIIYYLKSKFTLVILISSLKTSSKDCAYNLFPSLAVIFLYTTFRINILIACI